jgi:acetyl esterase
MLTVRDLNFYKDIRTDGKDASRDTTFAPLADRNLSGLPPTIVITAECDPLSSDGETYRDRILAAGGKAWWHEEAGLVHGYLRARHSVARARESFTRIVESIKALGRKEWTHPATAAAHSAAARAPAEAVHPID